MIISNKLEEKGKEKRQSFRQFLQNAFCVPPTFDLASKSLDFAQYNTLNLCPLFYIVNLMHLNLEIMVYQILLHNYTFSKEIKALKNLRELSQPQESICP